MPSSASSAHAFTCGTPGHGSGNRSLQMPGSTRSARPSSRLRCPSLTAGNLPVAILGRVAEVTERVPDGVTLVRAANAGPMTLSGTNTWLIGVPAWVIDPGPADPGHVERVWEAAQQRGGVAGIVLT